MKIGEKVRTNQGYSTLVLSPFPPLDLLRSLPSSILIKATEAERLVGKLDGITLTLPDLEFFLYMFVKKDATSSSQIEGTKAGLVDAIEKEAGLSIEDTDADDILYYIKGLNYGLRRLKEFPLSLRLIREIHAQVMEGARSTHFSDPGQFRKSQNWIGGTSPKKAIFVPPDIPEMLRGLDEFEKYLHQTDLTLPLIHIGLAHAQFETIHPFLDGNGRVGRLLITMLLCHQNLLEKPVLFLSAYFLKHQNTYYQKLNQYHSDTIEPWLEFFLEGIVDTANEAISISKEIRELRDEDMKKLQALGKRESESGVIVLSKLFGLPIVNSKVITDWTGFTRAGSLKLIERFVSLDILKPREEKGAYDRTYIYERYIRSFLE